MTTENKPSANRIATDELDLDFERAQFDTAVTTGTVASADALASRICNVCGAPITGSYYVHASTTICPRCQPNYLQKLGDSSFSTALLYGLIAAAGGALVWYGVQAAFDMQLGIIAIGIGIAVGLAVRKGAGPSTSSIYRVLAVALAYFAIVSTYIPMILSGIEGGASIGAYVFASGMSLVVPYFMIMSGEVMGLIIIGIGLWEAWRQSAPRADDQVAGPFQINAAA